MQAKVRGGIPQIALKDDEQSGLPTSQTDKTDRT